MLGVRNQRQEDQQRQRCAAHQLTARAAVRLVESTERRQVGDHQDERSEQRDEAGFGRYLAQPDRARPRSGEAPGPRSRRLPSTAKTRPGRSRPSRIPVAVEKHGKPKPAARWLSVIRPKCAEAPEHEGVRQARQRALANHLALQQHFPHELPDARPEGPKLKIGISARAADDIHRFAEAKPEKRSGDAQQYRQDRNLQPGWVDHAVTFECSTAVPGSPLQTLT